MGESTWRSTRTKKHRTDTGVSWAAVFRTGLHRNRSANETNQNDYLQNVVVFCAFFPTWVCLMDTEPPLFIFATTEQRTSTVLSGIWFGWRICNCFNIFPQHFYNLSLREDYIKQKLYTGNKCRVCLHCHKHL